MSVPADGDLVTLVAKVRHFDSSDNTFQFDVVNPSDPSELECVDTFISTKFVCRPSPSAFPIERHKVEQELEAVEEKRKQLLRELGTLNEQIGDREPL
ncbi:MAG: hypothetical protein JXR12_15365 [Neptunomonas phycophila]|uniref:hypothetical protein n=1 Tax=Neptunomonas phycophila TaxID=1572645 RepID=UPI003B8B5DB9